MVLGLAIGGGADAISGIFRNTMWNESIPPDVRGRMAGIEMISYSVGPTAGTVSRRLDGGVDHSSLFTDLWRTGVARASVGVVRRGLAVPLAL